jgi:hypothetical protein
VVVGKAIHSATCVSLLAAVNGKPVSLEYELADWQWRALP